MIIWASVDAFGATKFQGIQAPSLQQVIDGINACQCVREIWVGGCHDSSDVRLLSYLSGIIANVRGGGHWVLLTGA